MHRAQSPAFLMPALNCTWGCRCWTASRKHGALRGRSRPPVGSDAAPPGEDDEGEGTRIVRKNQKTNDEELRTRLATRQIGRRLNRNLRTAFLQAMSVALSTDAAVYLSNLRVHKNPRLEATLRSPLPRPPSHRATPLRAPLPHRTSPRALAWTCSGGCAARGGGFARRDPSPGR